MKEALDIILVERRLVESKIKAQWLIVNGFVKVNGKIVQKPREKVENSLKIELEKKFPYVAREGIKLEAALKKFLISVGAKVCLDVGASVGGFTDCLLKHGAKRIYVIDRATCLLHPSLRCNKNKETIITMLGRDTQKLININEEVDICTINSTYASLKAMLPNVRTIMKETGDIIALINPAFEIEHQNAIGSKYQIRDSLKLQRFLINVIEWCTHNYFYPVNLMKSPILEKKDVTEYLIHIKLKYSDLNSDITKVIKKLNK